MNFTFGYKKEGAPGWKGAATQNIFPSNSRPVTNAPGPYPSGKPPPSPSTITKIGIIKRDPNGIPYKNITFGPITCTNIGTSLPICYKKLPHPVKVWRKRLLPENKSTSKLKPTISQIESPGTVVQANCQGNSHVLFTDITHLSKCDGIKTDHGCVGGTNHIRRSSSTILDKKYCTTTREYLQKRCKSFEQNQLVGKNISGTAFKSGMGFEAGNVTGTCNVIQYKPNNNTFKVQGGVTSSSRTSLLKSQAITQSRQNMYKNPLFTKNNQCYSVSQDRAHLICR